MRFIKLAIKEEHAPKVDKFIKAPISRCSWLALQRNLNSSARYWSVIRVSRVEVPDIDEFYKILKLISKMGPLPDIVYHRTINMLKEVVQNERIDRRVVYKSIIMFLELWGGLQRNTDRIEPDELTDAVRNVVNLINSTELKELDILSADINAVGELIKMAFKRLKAVNNIGGTGASKILHILHPKLFIMWDKKIALSYGCKQTPEGYLKFLRKMQNMIVQLLREISIKKRITPAEARNFLERRFNKPITKIVDEYNWLIAHRKRKERLEQL